MDYVLSSGVIVKHPTLNSYAFVFQTFRGFPKIKIHPTESLEHGAMRTAYLELGIKVQINKYLGSYKRKGPITGMHKEIHLFLASTQETLLYPISAVIQEAKWIDTEKVLDYITLPEDIAFRNSIQNKL